MGIPEAMQFPLGDQRRYLPGMVPWHRVDAPSLRSITPVPSSRPELGPIPEYQQEVLHFAVEVFGDTGKASDWFVTPNRALHGKTPFELLDSREDSRIVMNLLGQIEYGIYS